MVLTKQRPLPDDDDSFPAFQLFVLAICRIAEPIALTSIFPYAFPMVKGFLAEDNEDAALYTGMLISSFTLAEALTGLYWGGLSDKAGRKPILLLGTFGTMASMIMTGLSTTFWSALIARLLGGLLNGNIAVIQSMVGELVRNPRHEPRAFAVMPFVWSIGTILGPAISGLTTDSFLFPTRPYLLPNLICAGILLISLVVSYFFLEETLPEKHLTTFSDKDVDKQSVISVLITPSGGNHNSDTVHQADSYGTFSHTENPLARSPTTISETSLPQHSTYSKPPTILSHRILLLITGLALYLYHSMAYDHLLPIFLQDSSSPYSTSTFPSPLASGLGLSTHTVGLVMSVNGLIALFIQAVVFPLLTSYLGLFTTFLVIITLHPIVYLLPPFLALLPPSLLYPGIYICLLIRNLFTIPAYPLFLILIKEAGDKRYLGKINGLAASVGALARCISPSVAGWAYAWGQKIGLVGVAWWSVGAVAVVAAGQAWWIRSAEMERRCETEESWHGENEAACDGRGTAGKVIGARVTEVEVEEEIEEGEEE